MTFLKNLFPKPALGARVRKSESGQAFVEYAVIVGAVAVVGLAAFSILGHKTNDIVATMAVLLPGAHADDNAAILSGSLVETTSTDGSIKIDSAGVVAGSGSNRLATNLGIDPAAVLVAD